jgi:hypothetical protein
LSIPQLRSQRGYQVREIARLGISAEVLLVAALFLVAIAVRFFRLGDWSFWPDEVFSLGTKSDGFNDSLLRRSLATDLIQLAVATLGASEWSARLVPALIGALSIPLLYLPLRRCLKLPGAVMVAALLTFSLWHVYWSQNARFYTLLFLFFNLGLLFFYRGLEEDRPWYMAAALVLFGLAARERLAALLGMPALIAYLAMLATSRFGKPRGLNMRNLAIFFVPALLAGGAFIAPFAANWEGWIRGFGRINNSPLFLASGTLYYVGISLVAFAAGSAIWHLRLRSRFALLMVLSALLPLLLIMAIALVQYTANRYIFFSLFSWLALAGLGIQALAERLSKDARFMALVVAGALIASSASDLFLYFTVQNGNRADWRSAFAYIAEHGSPGDRVVASDQDIFEYYLGSPFVYRRWDADPPPGASRVWYIEDLVANERTLAEVKAVEQRIQPLVEYDVYLPGRTFPMRVYFEETP